MRDMLYAVTATCVLAWVCPGLLERRGPTRERSGVEIVRDAAGV